MEGILQQMQRGNVVEYKPLLTIQDVQEAMEKLFYRDPTRKVRIYTGLIPGFYLQCAILIEGKYFIETYEKIYGLVQISLGEKHSLNKIVVNLAKDEEKPFKLIQGTTVLASTSSLMEALNKIKTK